MKMKMKLIDRLLSFFVCLAMVVGMLPLSMLTASAAGAGTLAPVADTPTINDWQTYFPTTGDINTKNAGGIWMDKSVFEDNTITVDEQTFTKTNGDNFFVALSAIGSNMTVTGLSQAPTDVMFVLDVSGSMDDASNHNQAADELVDATNASIKSLLDANPYNRVGIVLYSGSATEGNSSLSTATTILPLDRYTTTDAQERFLNYTVTSGWNSTTETISLNSSVRREGGGSVQSASKTVSGGTYIQAGLKRALDQFTAADTTVTQSGVGTIKRTPALVLMSDGAPTTADTDFYSPGTTNLGDGMESNVNYRLGFVTQLTASYVKSQVAAHYGSDCLFYTLGMMDPDYSIRNNPQQTAVIRNIVESVMDPNNTHSTIAGYWNDYLAASEGAAVSIGGGYTVTRLSDAVVNAMEKNYVEENGYFDANDYTSGGTLASALAVAFEKIIGEIGLRAAYHPTLISGGDSSFSGYVSFVDKIGSYMKVADIKGLVYDQHTFSGNLVTQKLNQNQNNNGNGPFVTTPPAAGTEGYAFTNSIATRLGISHSEAWILVRNAWSHGQLAYTDENTYSNWFGWISDAAGDYIGPWYEGMALPANTAFVNRSYIYLGDEASGASFTESLYATVRVREKVANGVLTGEQEVDFAIPASLLPLITYKVALAESGDVEDITVVPDQPISLIYEVGLDPEINKFNLEDKVSQTYINENRDAATGAVQFYTNKYDRNGTTGYNTDNTYAYFRPSAQNDRFYYQADSLVYDENKAEYQGAAHPKDVTGQTFYYRYNYYAKDSQGACTQPEEYHEIPTQVLSVATASGSGWTIPAGTVRSDYANAAGIDKTGPEGTAVGANPSGTLRYKAVPYHEADGFIFGAAGHESIVGATLGNNGRLSLVPETGIRITKAMADGVAAPAAPFDFTVEYTGNTVTDDFEAFAYRFVGGVLTEDTTPVRFENGKANVTLKAGETLYIGQMPEGEVIVTEKTTLDYALQTVSVDGQPQNGGVAEVSIVTGTMKDAHFINTQRGTGILNIAKSVSYPDGVSESAVAGKTFDVDVFFNFNEAPLAGFTVKDAAGNPYGNPTDTTGKLTLTIAHGQQITLYGIPEGTQAEVIEQDLSEMPGFDTPYYWVNNVKNDAAGGSAKATISTTAVADIMVANYYTPDPVSTNFQVNLTKNFFWLDNEVRKTVEIDADSYVFEFTLQKLDNNSWIDLADTSITYNSTTSAQDVITQTSDAFETVLNGQTYNAAGIYRYRVVETLGTANHVIYDLRTHSFGVEVTDQDMDGQWEIYQARTTSEATAVTITPTPGNAETYTVNVTFDNQYNGEVAAEAVIEIAKTVANPAGITLKPQRAGGEINLAEGFEFKIYEWDPAAQTAGTQVGTAQTTNSGGVTRFTIPYSEVGTFHYVIKETTPATAEPGWTYAADRYVSVKVSNTGGDMTAAAYLDDAAGSLEPNNAGSLVTVPFENRYAPAAAELELDFVSKEIDGRAFTAADNFQFVLEGATVNNEKTDIYNKDGGTLAKLYGYAKSNSLTPVNKAAVKFMDDVETNPNAKAVDKLYFHEVGTYYYTFKETSPSGNGIAKDETIYHVTVNVTNDFATGKLVAAKTITTVTTNDEITFVNRYTVAPTTLVIKGQKEITGRNLLENEFRFALIDTALGGGTIYATNTAETAATGEFVFPEITYTEAGSYIYTVMEMGGGTTVNGVTHSGAIFTVNVTVTDNLDGTLTADYDVNGTGTKDMKFVNTYAPTPIDVPIAGMKNLTGRALRDTKFTFKLYEADTTAYPWTPGDPAGQVQNKADGSFQFLIEDIAAAGQYAYVVEEVQGGEAYFEYDTTRWNVLISVTDNGKGTLTPTVTYMNGDGVQNRMEFINDYLLSDGSAKVQGHKELTGMALTDGKFTFELFETDETFAVADGADCDKFTTNTGSDFEFTFNYTKEDVGSTFYYVVRERNFGKEINGITYSPNQYHIAITVGDDYEGNLTFDKKITLNGDNAARLDFVNTYQATTSVDVNISKKVENKGSAAITPAGFEFLLEKVGTTETAKVKSETNGKAQIVLSYTQADIGQTYTYKLTEVAGSAEHVTYSTAAYTFTVAITKDDADKLVATVTMGDETVNAVAAEFVNVYDYTPPAPPSTPETGDSFNLILWAAMMAVSGGGIVGTAVCGKKMKEETEA